MENINDKYALQALTLIEKGYNLFITGKAGTGKTTLLKYIKYHFEHQKNIVILAPTGVAAKNANGVTIHSFLHLPISIYIPGANNPQIYKLRKEDRQAISNIDLLIIDEISMVRCDLLDEVNDVLCHYRKNSKPFGGIQVLLFGDLYQLMPVTKTKDWNILKEYYTSPYFFSSKIFNEIKCPLLELKKIYRQNDSTFISLLNDIRDGHISSNDLRILEQKYNKDFSPNTQEGYIRLTTHNWKAQKYNNSKLEEIPKDSYEYSAYVQGYVRWEDYPTNKILKFKCGARVMFIRNDNINHQYVNGTLGTIINLNTNSINVQTDSGEIIEVKRQVWDFYKYIFDNENNQLKLVQCGSFCQYPLKLAWAVTIHKSQGLTFDKVIIDAGQAFTYGQVYVALSRCRCLNNIVFASKIRRSNIQTDPIVIAFMNHATYIDCDQDNNMTTKDLTSQSNILEININHNIFEKIALGVKKTYKKSLTDKKTALKFIEDFNFNIENTNYDLCPFKPKPFNIIQFSTDSQILYAQIEDISFKVIKNANREKCWKIIYKLGNIKFKNEIDHIY